MKATAAVVTGLFGLLVLAGAPRRLPNQFLAIFLLLIAGNQAAETVRGSVDPGAQLLWFRIARACASLDPVMLYYFASVYPARNALNEGRRIALVLGVGAAFALLSPFARLPFIATEPDALLWSAVGHALTVFTAVVYVAVLAHLIRSVDAPGPRPYRWLVPAQAVAAVPVVLLACGNSFVLLLVAGVGGGAPYPLEVIGLTLAAPAGVVAILGLGIPVRDRRFLVASLLAGLALAILVSPGLLLNALYDLGRVASFQQPALAALGRGGGALRWLLFAIVASVAVLREDMLGMTMRHRRLAARVFLGLVAGGMVAVGFLALAPAGASLTPAEVGVVAVGIAASQAFRTALDAVGARVYRIPRASDPVAAQDAFRAAVAQAAAEGRALESDASLALLRDELGIDPRTADLLRRMVEAAPSPRLAPGALVAGRYRVVRLLGRGAAGRAFLCRDELLGRDVVLKEVRHDDDGDAAAALREARAAGALQHPNVLAIHDVLRGEDATVLVTEYVPGGSLADRVARRGPLPPDEARRMVMEVLAGLAALHRIGIVHRDVKPENILLGDQAKVADFGIAASQGGATARVGGAEVFAGTPGFMAPEQRRGAAVSASVDVYAAGQVLAWCCAKPLPARLARIVARSAHDDPARRWRSADAMRAALAAKAPR
ncbi:MAG: serine/threonine protein kinase [Halobacteriales archaeon]|nr:serine/threonine protein kinase [Halobacteriales archaeon]